MKDYGEGVIDGSPVKIKINQITCEYNYDNVLTTVGENNIPELAEWHVYGNEQQGRFSFESPALGRDLGWGQSTKKL